MVTAVSNPLITVGVFCGAVFLYLAATGHAPTLSAFLAFLGYVLSMGLIGIGVALGGSVLFLRYRDLNQVWDVATQAGFFVAPVIYPIGVIPERYHFYLYLWPPTVVIEFARATLGNQRTPGVTANLDLALLTVTVLAIGVLIYWRLSPRAAEYL